MRAKRRAAAIGLAALLTAAAACGAQGIALTVKVFPQNAELAVDGMLVGPQARLGSPPRVLSLAAGDHAIRLSAAGYHPRELTASLRSPLTLEVKLEREGSRLAKRSEMPTGRGPKSVAFTPDGRFILCALLEGEGVEAIPTDGAAGRLVLTPPAPWAAKKGFVEMAFLAGRQELWVTQMTTGMVHVFSLSDFTWLATFSAGGSWPKFLLVSPDERTAYVSNWESRDVSVIDTAARAATARIPVGGVPRGLALSRDGRFLYVCLFDRGAVQKVDLPKRAVARTLAFGEGAMRHIVMHPTKDLLYASDMLKGRILAIDASTDRLLAQIPVDRNLNTIALSPDGRYLFVSSRGPNNPEDYTKKGPAFGTISCIDTETRAVVDWTWGKNQPTGLAVSPDGRTIAFTNFLDDEIEVYDFSTEWGIEAHPGAPGARVPPTRSPSRAPAGCRSPLSIHSERSRFLPTAGDR
jgi:YVTN family beta-propeller protein